MIAPIREMLSSTRFIMGRVEQVDTERRTLQCSTLAGPREIAYDHLVRLRPARQPADRPRLAGARCRSSWSATRCTSATGCCSAWRTWSSATSDAERRALGHFVVIGGGFSGDRVAGAVTDFIASARRWYRGVRADELRVSLLHDTERLLPELPARLGRIGRALAAAARRGRAAGCRAARRCRRRGPGRRRAAGSAQRRLHHRRVRCHPLVEWLGLATQRGRIVTLADSPRADRPGLWAVGDAPPRPTPPTARPARRPHRFAVAQAEQMARNPGRHVRGQPTRAFGHRRAG